MDGETEEQIGTYTEEAMTLANMVLPILLTRKVLFQESFFNSSMVSSDILLTILWMESKAKKAPGHFLLENYSGKNFDPNIRSQGRDEKLTLLQKT